MALTNKPRALNIAKPFGLAASPQLHGKEKASQTYKAGAPLIDDDSGLLTESTSPIDATAVGKRTLGLALAAASGTTSKDVPIALLGPNVLVEATLSDSTAGTHTLAQTDQWKIFPVTKDPTFSTGNWYLDANAVSDPGGAIVVEFRDPIGTVDGRVLCIFTSGAIGPVNAASLLITGATPASQSIGL